MIHIGLDKTTHKVIELLLGGSFTAKNLQGRLKEKGTTLSTSGVYKVLKQLEEDDIVLKNKQLYSVSNEWKNSVLELLGQREEFDLNDGESVTFDSRSALQIDKHWKHYVFLFEKELKNNGLYFYNPHNFWIHVPNREESEKDFIAYTKNNNIRVYHTIGSDTIFDKNFAKHYRSETYQINLENISMFSHLDNITLFGDYIINTKISEGLSEETTKAYLKASDVRELKNLLSNTIQKPYRYKFKLERNHKKASLLAKRLGKNFIVK